MFARTLKIAMVSTAMLLSGCINDVVHKPVAALDYKHIAPLYVSAGQVEVVNRYQPSVESDKAASAFPTRPEDALNHYAENRLKSKGYEGTLKFVIADASVRQSVAQPDSTVMKWTGTGTQDRYDISIKINLIKTEGDGRESSHASIADSRFITIPRSYSIAKKQTTLRDFMEKLVGEVDGMVTSALQDQMHMTVTDGGGATAAGPATADNDGTVSDGPAVPAAPVSSVKPEALPPPW